MYEHSKIVFLDILLVCNAFIKSKFNLMLDLRDY